jgi:5-methylcytosine-specific restriction endonuclease McrBC GTP-binding regulatory subunit McrB
LYNIDFDEFSEFIAFMKKVYDGDLNYSFIDIYETFIHNQNYTNLMKKYCILYDMELKYKVDDKCVKVSLFIDYIHMLLQRELDFIIHNPDFTEYSNELNEFSELDFY